MRKNTKNETEELRDHKETQFHITVKSNLRTFLKIEGYDINEYGQFITENGGHNMMSLAKAISQKIDSKETPSKIDSNDPIYRKLPKFFKNCNIPYNKPNEAPEKNLDAYFTYEICELYHFPIEKVISKESITFDEAKRIMDAVKANEYRDKGLLPLSPSKNSPYFGTFYGYSLHHYPQNNTIIPFELSIQQSDDLQPIARYTYMKGNKPCTLQGVPYFISSTDAIAIEMLSEDHTIYQYLYFYGRTYSDSLIYRSGVCVRTAPAKDCGVEPEVKSFIITRFKLPENVVRDIVPGLLKISGNEFYILKSELDRLEAEKIYLREFHKDYEREFIAFGNSLFQIKERAILKSAELEESDLQIFVFKCLTEIKSHSLAPSRILYRNTIVDYSFFEDLRKL